MKKLILLFLLSTNCFAAKLDWVCIDTFSNPFGRDSCDLLEAKYRNGYLIKSPLGSRPITFIPDYMHCGL